MIADILENEDIFDENDDDEDGEEDEDEGSSLMTAQMKQQQPGSASPTNNSVNKPQQSSKGGEEKKESKESRDQRAFDKIKEYLHLTASAVKIKYPTIKSIQSDELIKKVKELPFYKYHDQMVRIMEAEIKKIERQKSMLQAQASGDEDTGHGRKPTMEKRRSFLDIFGFFGGDKNAESDDDSVIDDNKSDVSDASDLGDESIAERRSRRPSGSRKRRKSRKKKRKKSLDVNASSRKKSDAENEKRSTVPHGMSVQASQKRLRQKQ